MRLVVEFFDRKRQRDILIEEKKYKRRMRNPPTKKTKLQEYKNKKVHSKNKQTL